MNMFKGFSKMWFPALFLAAFVAGCAGNVNETQPNTVIPDTIAPTVTLTVPANGQTAVPFNRIVSVAFSENMDPASITTSTFLITGPGVTPVLGTVARAGTTATFTPTVPFTANTIYTGTITTGVKDLAGNAMASNFVFTFTTGAATDTTRPTVTGTINANGAIGVPTNTKVGVTFSETMDP